MLSTSVASFALLQAARGYKIRFETRAIQFSKLSLSLARERVRVRVVSSPLRPPHPSPLPQGGEGALRTE